LACAAFIKGRQLAFANAWAFPLYHWIRSWKMPKALALQLKTTFY